MTPCAAHAYRRASCPDCNEVAALFVPSKNLGLVALKKAQPDPLDQPDPRDILTDGVDSEGMVTRVRWISWTERLAMLQRESRGDVS